MFYLFTFLTSQSLHAGVTLGEKDQEVERDWEDFCRKYVSAWSQGTTHSNMRYACDSPVQRSKTCTHNVSLWPNFSLEALEWKMGWMHVNVVKFCLWYKNKKIELNVDLGWWHRRSQSKKDVFSSLKHRQWGCLDYHLYCLFILVALLSDLLWIHDFYSWVNTAPNGHVWVSGVCWNTSHDAHVWQSIRSIISCKPCLPWFHLDPGHQEHRLVLSLLWIPVKRHYII